jgi:ATP-dependent RNA helicase DeaD
MRRFKNKELKHLVATDVAARGIDIEDLSHVFIYSAPESSDQYIHRAGRTGRIGKTGKAISLVSGFDLMNFNRLVRANNLKAYECDLPSDEEVRRKEVIRIVNTLKDQASKLTAEERAEYDAMAQGILDQEDRVAIVAYLLKAHFEEEAARGVLDEAGEKEETEPGAAPQARGGGGGGRHERHGGHGRGGHGSRQGGHREQGGRDAVRQDAGHSGAPAGAPAGGQQAAAGSSAGSSGSSQTPEGGAQGEGGARRRRRRGRRGRGRGGSGQGGGQGGGDRGGPPVRGLGDHYT